MSQAKPFSISKRIVWEAYRRVKENKGAPGVDEKSIAEFERNLKGNLYRLWNRMSSGSYFPPALRMVKIEKKSGGYRNLSVPTVSDRIAQTIVRLYLEPKVEPYFHPDSYGYRPQKSAIQALGAARKRCWRNNWVIDLDIKAFFDNLDHSLVMKMVRKHTDCKWIHLYVERWLKAPTQLRDGTLVSRVKGTPQGNCVSPVISNLFLHYAFDEWMRRYCPSIPFERYGDDVIAHCKTEKQANWIKTAIGRRLAQYKLELHPEKTRIVYCKDEDRRGNYPNEKFDFLGYTFRPRRSKNRFGKYFINFTPAVSNDATRAMSRVVRKWRVHLASDKELDDISRMFNPIIRGWINYYGTYYKSELYPTLRQINRVLVRWAMRKYKKLKGHRRRTEHWLERVARREPILFAHWKMGILPSAEQ